MDVLGFHPKPQKPLRISGTFSRAAKTLPSVYRTSATRRVKALFCLKISFTLWTS